MAKKKGPAGRPTMDGDAPPDRTAKADRSGQAKVTVWLSRELADALAVFAKWKRLDMGQAIEPAVREVLRGFTVYQSRQPPAPLLRVADRPEGEPEAIEPAA